MIRAASTWHPSQALHFRLRPILSCLCSMRVAVTLLVVLGIASVIGTVLQQNQPYPDYLEKFGPFWFAVFERLGLFDVYTAGWFLIILGAVVLSTCVCLWRRSPGMLRQMRQFQIHHQANSLRALRHHEEWLVPFSATETTARAEQILRQRGYRTRIKHRGEARLLAGLAGRSNRLGYMALHLAIVVIAIGGLLDGNLGLKFREWRGDLITETRPLPIAELRTESRLPPGRDAFRGVVTIPEGDHASVAFLQLRDGYLLRELPFELRLEAFRVLHYASGEPRVYESDVVLRATELAEPLHRTIRVNEPLRHRGYTIFQAGFGDGGSALTLQAWPLAGGAGQAMPLAMRTFDDQRLQIGDRDYHLRITDFEAINAQPDGLDGNGRRTVRDVGPRIRYELRDNAGQRMEFESYMQAMTLEGQAYFVTGVRKPGNPNFRYLHIPADQRHSPARFSALAGLLTDSEQRGELAAESVDTVLGKLAEAEPRSTAYLAERTATLLSALADGGRPAMDRLLQDGDGIPGQAAPPVWLLERTVDQALQSAYRRALAATGDDPSRSLGTDDAEFLRHSMATIPALESFGAPLFLELDDFDLRQASTFEITRSPGKPVVYAGFLLLSLGVFLSFFVTYRRCWCWIQPQQDGASRLLFASTTAKDTPASREHFQSLAEPLRRHLQAVPAKPARCRDGIAD